MLVTLFFRHFRHHDVMWFVPGECPLGKIVLYGFTLGCCLLQHTIADMNVLQALRERKNKKERKKWFEKNQ